jgi:SpoVK/Ycf46/Vps4 family AAA+-type ATPase
MARSDLLVSLVRASSTGDRDLLKSSVEALIADERAKSHHSVAERLQKAFQAVAVTPPSLTPRSSAIANGRDAILELEPRVRLEELMLPLPVRRSGEQLVEEHCRADVLRAHGMEPRHRVLLSGPPGNGKTSFAEAVAEALALPFFLVRYDALIGSYLGETNTRLRKLFDYVRTQPCVLFFDEFDAIGKERGDTHETGEIKRVVSFLLMQFDQLPSYVITLAATNHAELLDRAVWRRFQMRLAFPAPDARMMAAFIGGVIRQWANRPATSASKIASILGPVSFAEAIDLLQNVRRREILGLGEVDVDTALKVELELWNARIVPTGSHAERSDQAPAPTEGAPKRQARRRATEEHT